MILVKIKETTEAFGADAEKAHAVQPEEVDWSNGLYLQAAGALEPLSSDGHRQMIVMGVQADPELLNAHHKAIDSISGPNGMTSKPTAIM